MTTQHSPVKLGVNIDHIATLRQQRDERYPDPIQAAFEVEQAGADGITFHLREDRRHIQDRDVLLLKEMFQTRLNFEMALTDEMIGFVEKVRPAACCIVPEKRHERTTEGGLDVKTNPERLKQCIAQLQQLGVEVSLFIEADKDVISHCHALGADAVEIHTGAYAEIKNEKERMSEALHIRDCAEHGQKLGLIVNAGHGLDYHNVQPIARIAAIHELNIGFAIIARAVFVGLRQATIEMKQLLKCERV